MNQESDGDDGARSEDMLVETGGGDDGSTSV